VIDVVVADVHGRGRDHRDGRGTRGRDGVEEGGTPATVELAVAFAHGSLLLARFEKGRKGRIRKLAPASM
jgi:hypothetical protein